jgi:hypothetical protein
MTCVAAWIEEGTVWMGADSAGVGGWDLTVRADEKVFINGEFLMGFTSSFRMGQLLRYSLQSPFRHPGVSIEKFMTTDFVDAVRNCLKTGGFAKKTNESEEGGTFLVGYHGRLFRIGDDYQVGESQQPFDAVGCGAALALGALHATRSMKADPKERLTRALEAAEQFSAGVRGPFTILEAVRELQDPR